MQESGYGSKSSAAARSAPGVPGTLRSRTETIREGGLSGDQPPRRVTPECDSGRTKAAEAQKDKRKRRRHFLSFGK